jgi:hypothetical protein
MLKINEIYNERFLSKNNKSTRYKLLLYKKLIQYYNLNKISYSYYDLRHDDYFGDLLSAPLTREIDIQVLKGIKTNKKYINNLKNKPIKYPNINSYYDLVIIENNKKYGKINN